MKTDEYGLSRRDKLALDAAKLYYSGQSQEEVAHQLHIARSTVSKLVNHAKLRGFIKVDVADPRENDARLVRLLQDKYSLSNIHLVAPIGSGPSDLRKALGRATASLLEDTLSNGDALALVWSETVAETFSALITRQTNDITVVQARGGFADSGRDSRIERTLGVSEKKIGASTVALTAPAFAASREQKKLLVDTANVKEAQLLWTQARTILYSVGACNGTSHLFRSGLLNSAEKEELMQKSVGDICSHYVDAQGRICMPDLDHRTIGISLPELRRKEQKILVAGGNDKVEVIHAALTWNYANVLVIDIRTARDLIALV